MNRTIVTAALVATLSAEAQAQISNPAAATVELASLGAGFEHGGMLEVGYQRPLGLVEDASARLTLQLPSSPGLGDGALSLAVSRGRVNRTGWGVAAALAASARWVDAELLGIGQMGFVAGGGAGFFRNRGFAAVELAWEHSLITYVRPSESYRRLVYADAPSGLHGAGGGTLRVGLSAGLAATARVEVGVRAGYLVTEQLDLVPGLPFYGVVDARLRF